MKTDKITGFLDKYSSDPKKALTLGIIIIVILVAIIIGYKFLKGKLQNLVSNIDNKIQGSIDKDEMEQRYPGQSKHYTKSEYYSMANQLYYAMYGAGTDEDQIKSVMKKMQSDLDVLELINAFGTKTGKYFSSFSGGLSEWLHDELSTSDLETYVNAPLRSNGVSYQF